MGIASAEAADEDGFLIGFVISVGVFEIQGFGGILHNGATAENEDRGWNRQAFGENGEFISHMVTIGVFADSNAVAVLPEVIGVIECFADPESAAIVPVHGDGLGLEVAFICVEPECHSLWSDVVPHGVFDGQRLLHGGFGGTLNTPLASWGVIGNFGTDINIFQGGQAIGNLCHGGGVERFEVDEGLDV